MNERKKLAVLFTDVAGTAPLLTDFELSVTGGIADRPIVALEFQVPGEEARYYGLEAAHAREIGWAMVEKAGTAEAAAEDAGLGTPLAHETGNEGE